MGAYDYLKLAVTWASSLNLKVSIRHLVRAPEEELMIKKMMVDVHGCPGKKKPFV